MHHDFIDDLLGTLNRVITPDRVRLRDILIFNGMPEETQNIRYLSYNQQRVDESDQTLIFSAAAVINNRRMAQWRLTGYREKLGRLVFNPRWTRSPLDLFLIRLRCDPAVVDILDAVAARYTLVGILQKQAERSGRLNLRKRYCLRPVVGVPGVDRSARTAIEAFENANEIQRNHV